MAEAQEALETVSVDWAALPRNTLELIANLLETTEMKHFKLVCKTFAPVEKCSKISFGASGSEAAAERIKRSRSDAYIVCQHSAFVNEIIRKLEVRMHLLLFSLSTKTQNDENF